METQTISKLSCDSALQVVGKIICPEKISPVTQRHHVGWKKSFAAYERCNPKTESSASKDKQWDKDKDISKIHLHIEGSASGNEEENSYLNLGVAKKGNDTDGETCWIKESDSSKGSVPQKKWLTAQIRARRFQNVFDQRSNTSLRINESDCSEYISMNSSDIHMNQ